MISHCEAASLMVPRKVEVRKLFAKMSALSSFNH
jgi:hypothetical protein